MPIAKIGYLYIIESERQKAVKLGFAVDPETRIAPLRTGNPDPINFRYMALATSEVEMYLHRHLKQFCIAREWYPDDGLLDCLLDDLSDEAFDRSMAKLLEGLGEYEDLVNDEPIVLADAKLVLPRLVKEHAAWIAAGRPVDEEAALNPPS